MSVDLSRRALLTGQLFREELDRRLGKVELSTTRCLAHRGVICSSCATVCPEQAIRFGLRGRPTIVPDRCTGCGDCLGPCPTSAFSLRG